MSGALPVPKSRQDTDYQVQTAYHIAKGGTAPHRIVFGPASDTHNAAPRLRHSIISRTVLIRAGGTKAGDTAIDQARIYLLQFFITKSQLFHRTRAEIFNENIHLFHKFQKCFFTLFQIQSDSFFAAVKIFIVAADAIFHGGKATAVVAAPRLLQLDHLCPHITKQRSGRGPSQHAAHV